MDSDDGVAAGAEHEIGEAPTLGEASGEIAGHLSADGELAWAEQEAFPPSGCGGLVNDPAPISVSLPSGVLVEFTDTSEGIHVVLHGPAGSREVVMDSWIRPAAVTVEEVVVPEPVVETGSGTTQNVEPPDWGQPLVVEDGGTSFEVGTPHIDTDGDGRADAVIVEEEGLRTVAIDLNGDGRVDRLEMTDLASDHLVVLERQADGSWSPVAETESPQSQAQGESVAADVFAVPPEAHLEPLGPDAPLEARAVRKMQETILGFVSEFFPSAFPGESWPLQDNGRPVPTEVLLRLMASDANPDPATQTVARDLLSRWERGLGVSVTIHPSAGT